MIRIREQEKHRKVERDESVGNVSSCSTPCPCGWSCVKNTQKPTVTAQSGRYVQDNNCESHCHLGFTLFTKGSHHSSVRHMLLILQSAIGGCVLLTKLTVMVSHKERQSFMVVDCGQKDAQ